MHRLQELLRLHRQGVSARRAAQLLKMSRNTVRQYLAALDAAGLLVGEVDDLPKLGVLREAVDSSRPCTTGAQEQSSVELWRPAIERLEARGVGPKAIYDTLRLEHSDFQGSYYAVKRLCARRRKERPPNPDHVAIPVETSPGQVAQVDFFEIGKLWDPKQGRLRRCWLFVMVLAFSRHLYIDFVFDQRAETWQLLHVAAFVFFGGVPHVVVPDNLKAAVIRAAFNSSGEIALNRSYAELARYYGFLVDPTPAYSPQKKGKVERAGRYVRDSYCKPRDFADLQEARAGRLRWVTEIAGARTHGTTGRKPLELFESVEQAALLPLPTLPFAPTIWHQAKVHTDSHLQFRQHLYSVPWRLLGQQLWVRATHETVTVHTPDERVATHRRCDGHGRTTESSHLPPAREQWRRRDRGYWEEQALGLGEEVFTYVSELFEAQEVLLQLRKVQAIVTFLRDYPPERREAACRRARHFGVTHVGAFKDILRKELDLEPLPGTLLPTHGALEEPRFARSAAAFTRAHPTPEA
jgi:transposase